MSSLAKVRIQIYFDFNSNYSFLALSRLVNRSNLPSTSHPTLLPPAYLITSQQLRTEYRPIVLSAVFKKRNNWGINPYEVFPEKAKYLWRDFERQCWKYGIVKPGERYKQPSVFPRNSLHALRIACALFPPSLDIPLTTTPTTNTNPISTYLSAHPIVGEKLGQAFTLRVYESNFLHNQDIHDISHLAVLLHDAVADPSGPGAMLAANGHDPASVVDHVLAMSTSDPIKALLRANTDEALRVGVFGAPTFVVAREGMEKEAEMFWGNDRLDKAFEWGARLVLDELDEGETLEFVGDEKTNGGTVFVH